MKYLFFDTETSGLNKKFDHPISFSGRVYDQNFTLIDEIDLQCGLRPHCIPSCVALAKNYFSIEELKKTNLSYYEMIGQIYDFFYKHTPCFTTGFNNISFDSELLRQAFYQNLLPPYVEQTLGNERFDLYPTSIAAAVFVPGAIKVGLNQKQKFDFRLEALSKKNEISHVLAHTASSDTLATAELCKKIKENAPTFFDECLQTTSKKKIRQFLNQNTIFCQAPMFDQRYIFTELFFDEKKGDVVVFDLNHDPTDYVDLSVQELTKIFRSKQSPFKILKNNKHLLLFSLKYRKYVSDLSDQQLIKNADTLRSNKKFCETLSIVKDLTAKEWPEGNEVEQKIYSKFPSDFDSLLMKKFHQSNWDERSKICNQFEDNRWKELGHRIIYENNPAHLDKISVQQIEQMIQERFHHKDNMPRSLHQAIDELEKYREKNPGVDQSPLEQYEEYLRTI